MYKTTHKIFHSRKMHKNLKILMTILPIFKMYIIEKIFRVYKKKKINNVRARIKKNSSKKSIRPLLVL